MYVYIYIISYKTCTVSFLCWKVPKFVLPSVTLKKCEAEHICKDYQDKPGSPLLVKVSWNRGTPSYHPFLGFFILNQKCWGTPMTIETFIWVTEGLDFGLHLAPFEKQPKRLMQRPLLERSYVETCCRKHGKRYNELPKAITWFDGEVESCCCFSQPFGITSYNLVYIVVIFVRCESSGSQKACRCS